MHISGKSRGLNGNKKLKVYFETGVGARRNRREKGRAEQVRARNCLHGELLPYAVEDTRTLRTQRQRYISKTLQIHICNALFISFFFNVVQQDNALSRFLGERHAGTTPLYLVQSTVPSTKSIMSKRSFTSKMMEHVHLWPEMSTEVRSACVLLDSAPAAAVPRGLNNCTHKLADLKVEESQSCLPSVD